jgi:hypothetical protein
MLREKQDLDRRIIGNHCGCDLGREWIGLGRHWQDRAGNDRRNRSSTRSVG